LNSKREQISEEPILVFISPQTVTCREYLENALKEVATLLKSVAKTPGRFFKKPAEGKRKITVEAKMKRRTGVEPAKAARLAFCERGE
jgi:hypothetical protein